jgi:hypothetical protein
MPNLQPPSSSSEAIPVTGTSGPWNDCEKRDGSVQRGWEETHWATAQTVEENKGRRTGASSLRGGLFDPVLRAQVRQEERNALIHFLRKNLRCSLSPAQLSAHTGGEKEDRLFLAPTRPFVAQRRTPGRTGQSSRSSSCAGSRRGSRSRLEQFRDIASGFGEEGNKTRPRLAGREIACRCIHCAGKAHRIRARQTICGR